MAVPAHAATGSDVKILSRRSNCAAPDDVDGNNNEGCYSIQSVTTLPATKITHVDSKKALRIMNGHLLLSELQDEDTTSSFRCRQINAFRDSGNGAACRLAEFDAATSTSVLYVVAENTDNQVDVKCMSPPEAKTVDTDDPRYFVQTLAEQSFYRFESIKRPGYFLTVDDTKQYLVLRELKRDQSDSQFNFLLRPDKKEDDKKEDVPDSQFRPNGRCFRFTVVPCLD